MAGEKEVSFTIPRKRPFDTIFQFKITLLGAEPPVWRRIQAPAPTLSTICMWPSKMPWAGPTAICMPMKLRESAKPASNPVCG